MGQGANVSRVIFDDFLSFDDSWICSKLGTRTLFLRFASDLLRLDRNRDYSSGNVVSSDDGKLEIDRVSVELQNVVVYRDYDDTFVCLRLSGELLCALKGIRVATSDIRRTGRGNLVEKIRTRSPEDFLTEFSSGILR